VCLETRYCNVVWVTLFAIAQARTDFYGPALYFTINSCITASVYASISRKVAFVVGIQVHELKRFTRTVRRLAICIIHPATLRSRNAIQDKGCTIRGTAIIARADVSGLYVDALVEKRLDHVRRRKSRRDDVLAHSSPWDYATQNVRLVRIAVSPRSAQEPLSSSRRWRGGRRRLPHRVHRPTACNNERVLTPINHPTITTQDHITFVPDSSPALYTYNSIIL
jgi:hypothetical protein